MAHTWCPVLQAVQTPSDEKEGAVQCWWTVLGVGHCRWWGVLEGSVSVVEHGRPSFFRLQF